jgi:hypothetical protein
MVCVAIHLEMGLAIQQLVQQLQQQPQQPLMRQQIMIPAQVMWFQTALMGFLLQLLIMMQMDVKCSENAVTPANLEMMTYRGGSQTLKIISFVVNVLMIRVNMPLLLV